MLNPWVRIQHIANMLGLMLTAAGVFLVGFQLNSLFIMVVGAIAFLPFLVLFSILIALLIDDYLIIFSHLKRRFLGIPY